MSCPFARQSSSYSNSYGSGAVSGQYQSSQSYSGNYAGSAAATGSNAWSSNAQHGSSWGSSSRSRSRSQYASGSGAQQNYTSQIEQAVINARQPIETREREQITAGQYRGIYLNKQEADSWRGPVPITQYRINEDSNPEVVRKRLDKVRYQQEVSVRYLNPPAAPKPGDLIIRERQTTLPAAPPVVLRQEGQGASTPTPQVLREHPPRAPARIPEQVVEVEGEPTQPPARRVVVEKLSNLPPKPQNVIIEKWLPYKQQRRRVVYQKSCAQAAQNPRNLIIEWEAPEVDVQKVCKNLGTVQADPEEYVRRYGSELKPYGSLPTCDGESPCGGAAGASHPNAGQETSDVPELEGDVQALRLVDLERHGLGAYRRFVH